MSARYSMAVLLGPVLASSALVVAGPIPTAARELVQQPGATEQIVRHVTPLGTTKPDGAALVVPHGVV